MYQDNPLDIEFLNWYKSIPFDYTQRESIITLPSREELLAQENDDCDNFDCSYYNSERENLITLPSKEELLAQDNDDYLIDGKILGICELADYEDFILSEDAQYTKPLYTLSYQESLFAPITGIHIITGQSGNGKTMLLTQIIVALLKGQYGQLKYQLSEIKPNPKVLYIDTEMEEFNTIHVRDRINHLLERKFGEKHNDFTILRLREIIKTEERWQIIISAVHDLRPTIIIIDGLIDLVKDVNDYSDCSQIISQCSTVASKFNCSLWGVIHENPGTTKLVGHLGSIAERKATDVLQTTKNNTDKDRPIFEVSHKKARGKDLPDWSFWVDDSDYPIGIPIDKNDCKMPTSSDNKDEPKDDLHDKIKKAFNKDTNSALTFTQLQKKLGSSKNGKAIKKAIDLGYIEKKKDDKYYLKVK